MPVKKENLPRLVDCDDPAPQRQDGLSDRMWTELDRLDSTGLSPSSALSLLKALIIESADADKTRIEKLKMIDKLLNTARAIMETGVKHEETAIIRTRLEQLEDRLQRRSHVS